MNNTTWRYSPSANWNDSDIVEADLPYSARSRWSKMVKHVKWRFKTKSKESKSQHYWKRGPGGHRRCLHHHLKTLQSLHSEHASGWTMALVSLGIQRHKRPPPAQAQGQERRERMNRHSLIRLGHWYLLASAIVTLIAPFLIKQLPASLKTSFFYYDFLSTYLQANYIY